FNLSSTDDVLKELSIPDKKIAALLGLGREFSDEDEIYEEILEIIALQKGEDCGLAVAQFLKTEVGFELLNSNTSISLEKMLTSMGENFKEDALPVLEKFFGGTFGLDLTNEVLKNIKTEEVACLATYATT